MHPQVLLGHLENMCLQQAIESLRIGHRLLAREVIQRRADVDAVAGIAREALGEVGQHGSTRDARQARGCGGGGGRTSEEIDHRGALVAVTLVRRIPDHLIVLQGADHGADVIVGYGMAMLRELRVHGVRDQLVLGRAVDDIEGYHGAEDARGDLDRGEMAADHDGPAAFAERSVEVLEAPHLGEPVDLLIRAPPGRRGFAHRHPQARAVSGQQGLALGCIQRGQAQFDVALGNADPGEGTLRRTQPIPMPTRRCAG